MNLIPLCHSRATQPIAPGRPQRLGPVALVAALLCGCAHGQPQERNSFYDEDDPGAGESTTGSQPIPLRADAPRNTQLPGVGELAGEVPRAQLIDVLDGGPGRLLQGIEVRAVFQNRRFSGWEIQRFEPADERLGSAPLRPGDVVLAVNDTHVERPEQLQRVWDELRTAQELIITGQRAGAQFQLRYSIVEP